MLDENNEIKACGLECKSRSTHSAQQHAVAQLMSGSGTCSKVKWDDRLLNYHVLSFHKKAQTLHHAVVCDLDIILLLAGKKMLNIKIISTIFIVANLCMQAIVAEPY